MPRDRSAASILGVMVAFMAAVSGTTNAQARPTREGRLEVPKVDGLAHGPSARYDANGVVRARGTYQRGRRHGVFTLYSARGAVVGQVAYRHGIAIWQSSGAVSEPPPEVLAYVAERLPGVAPTDDRVVIQGGAETVRRAAVIATPHFALLDRAQPVSRAGTTAALGTRTDGSPGIGAARVDGFINVGTPRYGFIVEVTQGGYITDSDASLSGATLLTGGGAVHWRLGHRVVASVAGYVSVPTLNYDHEGLVASYNAGLMRPQQLGDAVSSQVLGRATGVVRGVFGRWFFHGEAGFAAGIGGPGTDSGPTSTYASCGIGAGARIASFVLSAESACAIGSGMVMVAGGAAFTFPLKHIDVTSFIGATQEGNRYATFAISSAF